MPTKVEFMSEQIGNQFVSDYKELLAFYPAQAVVDGIRSFLSLNYTPDELTTAPVTPGGGFRKMLALALLTLINREALTPLTDNLNELAENDLAKLHKETGIDLELIVASAPPPPTEAQLLEHEVRSDWRTLSMDKIRQKKNASRKYSETLERLANAGTLESSVTALTRAGA
jgi:hypothetical protein